MPSFPLQQHERHPGVTRSNASRQLAKGGRLFNLPSRLAFVFQSNSPQPPGKWH